MTTTDNTIPPQHRTWPRRILRFALWSLATLITLYALAFASINWWGARRLAQSVARVKAAAETLDFDSLIPKAIAPETNYCAIKFLDGVTDSNRDELMPHPAHKSLVTTPLTKSAVKRKLDLPKPALGESHIGRQLSDKDYQEQWIAWFRDSTSIPLPAASNQEARDLRAAMETAYPILLESAKAAADRPLALFTPGIGAHGPISSPMTIGVPHYNVAQSLARLHEQHAIASLVLRDGDAAFADIRAMLRLASAVEREPLWIAQLVGLTIRSIDLATLWKCLESRLLTDAQLQTLIAEFSAADTQQGVLLAARGEMAGMFVSLQTLDSMSFSNDSLSRFMGIDSRRMPGMIRYGGGYFVPHGFMRNQGANRLDEMLNAWIIPLRERGLMGLYRNLPKQMTAQSDDYFNVIRLITGTSVIGDIGNVVRKAVFMEVTQRQALIACALERYFAAHQDYPTNLSELSPRFIPAILTDPFDDQPMRYRRTAEGRYMLWSIGVDGKDDQGKIITNTRWQSGMSAPDFKGDWRWLYQVTGKAETDNVVIDEAARRGMRLLFALKKYASSHRGDYPLTLTELVKEGMLDDTSLVEFAVIGDQKPKPWLYNSHINDSSPASDALLASPVSLKDGTRMIVCNGGEVRFISEEDFKKLHPFHK